MAWNDLTLPHQHITGKNLTDNVTTVPKTNTPLADPIPADTKVLAEAKKRVEVACMRIGAIYVLSFGNDPGVFFGKCLDNPFLSIALYDLIGWAWIVIWMDSTYTEEGDRRYIAMQRAESMLKDSAKVFMDMAAQILGVSDRPSETPSIRGRVSSIDAHESL